MNFCYCFKVRKHNSQLFYFLSFYKNPLSLNCTNWCFGHLGGCFIISTFNYYSFLMLPDDCAGEPKSKTWWSHKSSIKVISLYRLSVVQQMKWLNLDVATMNLNQNNLDIISLLVPRWGVIQLTILNKQPFHIVTFDTDNNALTISLCGKLSDGNGSSKTTEIFTF